MPERPLQSADSGTDIPSGRIAELLAGDRSLTITFAALLKCVDRTGTTTLDALALAYRDMYLDQRQREGHDAAHEGGLLAMSEVRSYLALSALPRLAALSLIELHEGSESTGGAVIQLRPGVRDHLEEERDAIAMAIRTTGEHPRPLSRRPSGGSRTSVGSVLSAEGLTKAYRGRKVVNDVALNVRQGEIVGLLGPNGAGKTTTFYMLVGLIAPQLGRIFLDGKEITGVPMYERARRGIGYLSQEPSVFRKLSVEDNILAILETLPLSKAERRSRLETLLNELNIAHLRKSRAFQLSGGERRRLEITRALVTEPKFMMLDEPFAGVDPIAVHDIQTIVADLRTRGIGVLISDHNVEQTLDIVDRAYIMFEGEVQVSGTVSELVYDPLVSERYLGPTLTARLRSRIAANGGAPGVNTDPGAEPEREAVV